MTSFGVMVSDASVGAGDDAGGGDDGGGGALLTVQLDRVAVVAVAEPSLTSTVQSAGFANGSFSILKLPDPSLVPSRPSRP
jgi:hypothetical protein